MGAIDQKTDREFDKAIEGATVCIAEAVKYKGQGLSSVAKNWLTIAEAHIEAAKISLEK